MRRREFLKSAAFAAVAAPFSAQALLGQAFPAQAFPASPPGAVTLRAARRVIDVDGKAASVFGLLRPDGGHGVTLAPGERFAVRLLNVLDEPTIVHWHGQTPGWFFDGVADAPLPLLRAGEVRDYDFAPAPGTHFMHAHTLQEQALLSAPLIVRNAQDLRRDEQEVVLFLHDFSFKSPQEMLDGLTQGAGHGAMNHEAMDHGAMDRASMNHDAMNHAEMNHAAPLARGGLDLGALGMSPPKSAMDHAAHSSETHSSAAHAATPHAGMGHAGAMDLNDVEYDAYLANDRTLGDPEVVRVAKGGRVRLRIVNASASTAFHIDCGALDAQAIAVDGQPVRPLALRRAPLSMGQRLDLVVTIPRQGGAFPILARREGAVQRAGIILATQGARVAKLARDDAKLSAKPAPALSLDLERRLRALTPLAPRRADRVFSVALSGDMTPYRWGMASDAPLVVRAGERVEIDILNRSMMSHPMHLHGHHFQVVAIDGRPLAGALRDTVLVPPGARVRIAFDAINPGRWAFHCHHLYHMFTGMMGRIDYEGVA
jgi:FtsP/CotA-like multicopper oxidase with cupredoxin domain